tara:strand:- start:10512 stop:11960 length:1449 start_codon:yes stop_codon:yes gene_type:complete
MNEGEILARFWNADEETRDSMILDPITSDGLTKLFGTDSFVELRNIAERRIKKRKTVHLASENNPKFIFIPGVMGSLLQGKIDGGVWWIDAMRGLDKIDQLGLAANGGDPKDEKKHVVPFGIDFCYEGFLLAAFEQGLTAEKHPYDWRKSLLRSTSGLANHIEQVWKQNGHKKHSVNLVAHSMGGLLIRATLMEHKKQLIDKIGRIVFLATPHYGSPSIAYFLRDHLRGDLTMWLLGKYLSRETFRSLWGPIGLLPAPMGVYPGTRNGEERHPCAGFNLYSADSWQLDLPKQDEEKFQNILNHSAEFYQRLFLFHDEISRDLHERMAMIIGVGHEMPFHIDITSRILRKPRTDVIMNRDIKDIHREGDGSVPVASAELEGIGETKYVKAKHAAIPNVPSVYLDVFRFLRGESMELPDSLSGALATHLSTEDTMSCTPHLDGSGSSDRNRGWNTPRPTEEEWKQLEKDLQTGRLPEFAHVRIL